MERVIGAAKLSTATYEEVENDRGATMQAMSVVVLSAVAAGIGGAGRAGARGFVMGAIAALIGWYIWAFLTWLIGTKMLATPETNADIGQLLRTTGFSAGPGMLRALGGIPVAGSLILLVSSIWMLAAMIVAVRQALDYRGTGRAVAVCLIGFLVNVAIIAAVTLPLGLAMMGATP
jgi:hypothetical protein